MNPWLAIILMVMSWVALLIWIVIYFALVERLLKSIVGSIFGVTIGGFGSEFLRQRYNFYHPTFLRGWHITSPAGSVASGCLSDTVIWIIGGVFRVIFITGPIVGVIVLDIFLLLVGLGQPKS